MNKTAAVIQKLFLIMLMANLVLPAGTVMAKDKDSASAQDIKEESSAKYDRHLMWSVRESLGVSKHDSSLDGQIESMPQVGVMDAHLESFGKKIKGKEVRKAVWDVFEIDLDLISEHNYGNKLTAYDEKVMEMLRASLKLDPSDTSRDGYIMDLPKSEVMDRYIREAGSNLTGAENRFLINQIFGVNLEGISGLEHAQLGISSKGQWIVRSETDLFLITSSLDDVDVYVEATDYYEQVTGTNEVPESLKTALLDKGFIYDAATDSYMYSNPTGESIPDDFKGQTIGLLMGAIQQINANY